MQDIHKWVASGILRVGVVSRFEFVVCCEEIMPEGSLARKTRIGQIDSCDKIG
jgi:hypothetical protein